MKEWDAACLTDPTRIPVPNEEVKEGVGWVGGGGGNLHQLYCKAKRNAVNVFACPNKLYSCHVPLIYGGFMKTNWGQWQMTEGPVTQIKITVNNQQFLEKKCWYKADKDDFISEKQQRCSLSKVSGCIYGLLYDAILGWLCTPVPTELDSVCLCRTGSVQQEQEWHLISHQQSGISAQSSNPAHPVKKLLHRATYFVFGW